MKNFSLGIIKHNCSNAMKRGKLVQVYNFLKRVMCPNCKRNKLHPQKLYRLSLCIMV